MALSAMSIHLIVGLLGCWTELSEDLRENTSLLFFMLPASPVGTWSSRSRNWGRSDMKEWLQRFFTACWSDPGLGKLD